MRLAWKELWYQKKKYSLIELVIILLMFMVLFLSGLANGLGAAVDSAVDKSGADYFVVSDTSEDLLTVSNIDEKTVLTIQKQARDAGVKTATLDVIRMYLQRDPDADKLDAVYFAIEPSSFLEPELLEGTSLDQSGEEHPIILDDNYQAEGFAVGDNVYDASSQMKFKVVGFTKDHMYGHVSAAYITRADYEQIMNTLSAVSTAAVHSIAISGRNFLSELDIKGIQVDSKERIIDNLPGYKAEQTTINMITWVLVVVSSAIIGVFYFIITLQKEREFGVMKAIGVSMRKLSSVICAQVFIVAGAGVLLANLLAFGMAAVLPGTMPFALKGINAFAVSIVFVLISLAASLLSLIKVAKVDAVSVIGGAR